MAVPASLCLLLLFALIPAVASAGETRPLETVITGSPGVTIANPGGIAIDESTGNVFVNDGPAGGNLTGTGLVDILGVLGGTPVGLVSPYQLTGFSFNVPNNGIAYDNNAGSPAKGTIYVAAPAGKIKKFTRNPASEKYEAAGELIAVPPAGRAFSATTSTAGATVDTLGNLFVGDFNCQCIVKFSPTGTQVAKYDLGSPNPIVRPGSVAVDGAGNLFVARQGTGEVSRIAASALIPPVGSDTVVNPPVTQIVPSGSSGLAIDAPRNNLYIALGNRVTQYDTTTLTEDFTFGLGNLGTTARLAANSATDRVYVSDNGVGKKNVAVFGPPILLPSVTTKAASDVTGTKATLNGVINPQGNGITECKFEYGLTTAYGKTAPCVGATPTDSNDHEVTANISGLTPNGTSYHFRLWVNSVNGEASPQGVDRSFVTDNTVVTEPATSVGITTATLNGIVRPEGEPLTDCKFEYGTTTLYGQSIPCNPAFGAIPDDFDSHTVTGALTGLAKNTTYHFRLSATNAAGTAVGGDLTFTTIGPPQIVEQRPLEVDQDSAILQAKINPSGLATTYYFEFGSDTSYGTRIPADHDLFVGSGTAPVTVSANRSELHENTVYHFRVIATNSDGTTVGPDQQLETLNSNGLPASRGFELVSPADKRPVGNMEQLALVNQLYQPTESGDQVGFLVLNGIEGSPAGGEVIFAGKRSSQGWSSTEISPPSLVSPPEGESSAIAGTPSFIRYLDPHDLKCGLIETFNPITADTPQADVEFGVSNLYRWNASDETYTLLTSKIPFNPTAKVPDGGYFKVAGVSEDCSRIVFWSRTYSFIEGATGLYEWKDGVLRDAALRPDGSTPTPAQISPGAVAREKNSVALNGRFFFTATSTQPGDVGKAAVFVRKGPATAIGSGDITLGSTAVVNVVTSAGTFAVGQTITGPGIPAGTTIASVGSGSITLSRGATATANGAVLKASEVVEASRPTNGATLGARYVGGSPDGSHVFFLANYGIAATSSVGPTENCTNVTAEIQNTACDLYAYDVEEETLSDVSAHLNPADTKGAVVQSPMAISEDGSVVYFAARGQLVPGKGRTYAENLQGSGFANVYRYDAMAPPAQALTYVGSVTALDLNRQVSILSTDGNSNWSSQTNVNGSYFLYTSRDKFGVNNPNGVESAYLFSAATGATVCVSCPSDGSAPKTRQDNFILGIPSVVAGLRQGGSNVPPVSLSDDGRVIFNSEEVLAPGAIEGQGQHLGSALWEFLTQNNIYEWHQGQVSTLATGAVETLGFGGPNGRDVFIKSFSQLSPYDFDFSADVYDVRSGGGFPPPPAAPLPCDPASGDCQGPGAAQPEVIAPASAAFSGPGNPATAKSRHKRCRKGQVKRRGRCVKARHRARRHHRGRKPDAKRSQARPVNADLGGIR